MPLTSFNSSGVSSVSAMRAVTSAKSEGDCVISAPTNPAGNLPDQFGPISNRFNGPGTLNWLPIAMGHQREGFRAGTDASEHQRTGNWRRRRDSNPRYAFKGV